MSVFFAAVIIGGGINPFMAGDVIDGGGLETDFDVAIYMAAHIALAIAILWIGHLVGRRPRDGRKRQRKR